MGPHVFVSTRGIFHKNNGSIWLVGGLEHFLFFHIWVGLKIVYIPNEIAIFHRDNDQQNHWV